MGSRFRQAGGLSPLLGDRGKGILEFKRARLNGSGIVEDLVDETGVKLVAVSIDDERNKKSSLIEQSNKQENTLAVQSHKAKIKKAREKQSKSTQHEKDMR